MSNAIHTHLFYTASVSSPNCFCEFFLNTKCLFYHIDLFIHSSYVWYHGDWGYSPAVTAQNSLSNASAPKRTCREHEHRVVPKSSLLQSQGDVAHSLIHGWHHASVQSAVRVSDETVRGHVAFRRLQGCMDRLQRHIEKQRLKERDGWWHTTYSYNYITIIISNAAIND